MTAQTIHTTPVSDHVFTVEFNGEFYQCVYPEPLSELSCFFESASAAWLQLVTDRVQQPNASQWPLDDKGDCRSALLDALVEAAGEHSNYLQHDFLNFKKGTYLIEPLRWIKNELENLFVSAQLNNLDSEPATEQSAVPAEQDDDPRQTALFVQDAAVIDPDTGKPVRVTFYKDNDSGALFAIDNEFVQSLDDDDPVNNPFNGRDIYLQEDTSGIPR